MKHLYRIPLFAVCLAGLFSALHAQQVKRTAFDVSHYVIDARLEPLDNQLTATSDVTFTLLEDGRNVTFELNGSLKVDSITRVDGTPAPANPRAKTPAPAGPTVTFVQDQVGVSDLGPSVRVDLGDNVAKGTP